MKQTALHGDGAIVTGNKEGYLLILKYSAETCPEYKIPKLRHPRSYWSGSQQEHLPVLKWYFVATLQNKYKKLISWGLSWWIGARNYPNIFHTFGKKSYFRNADVCERITDSIIVTNSATYTAFVHLTYDDVMKWKHFPRYWPFVRGIHLSPVNSPHIGQWSGDLMFFLICAWTNSWANNGDVGDLRRNYAPYDVIVMILWPSGAILRHGTSCLAAPNHNRN